MFEPHYAESTVAFHSPSILSNFHECEIQYQGNKYPSVEHGYQHTKATSLGCNDITANILSAKTARDAKVIAKKIPDDEAWDIVKLEVMSDLLKIKMESCPNFKEAIIQTGDGVLAEATGDLFWASGLSPDLTLCMRPSNYPGPNELGKLLMELRSLLLIAEELGNTKTPGTFDDSVFDMDAIDGSDKSENLYPSSCLAADSQSSRHNEVSVTPFDKVDTHIVKQTTLSLENKSVETERQQNREVRKVIKPSRSSSVPGRRSQMDTENNEARQMNIQKWLGLKRQASSSPVKEGTNVKQKSAKTQAQD